MALLLYRFRYCDPRIGKWVRARRVATIDDIRATHAEFELTGPSEVREVNAGTFNPHRRPEPARDRDEDDGR